MATEQSANELKQQGALEASRDAQSSVSAEDAERKVLEESKSAGVAAFKFDPDATTAEKKAQAREVSKYSVVAAPALSTDSSFSYRPCLRDSIQIDVKAQRS